MKDGQESIYYISADSIEAAQGSPHIEALKARGMEVLFMTEPVDEWVVQSLVEFEEKPLVSAVKGSLDLPEDKSGSTPDEKETQGEFEALLGDMQGALATRVKEVRLTHRLTESPACLVVDEHGMSPYMERILKANGRDVPAQKRILELNPGHPVVRSILRLSGDAERKQEVGEWSQMLFDQALVAEGSLPEDPAEFARNVTKLMQRAVALPEQVADSEPEAAETAETVGEEKPAADGEAPEVGIVPSDTPIEVEVVTLDEEEESAPVADLDEDDSSILDVEPAEPDPSKDEEPEPPADSERESAAEP
jgi:molecular chaperone HtpG